MDTICIEVQSQIIDGRSKGPKLETIAVELMEDKITVAELIRRTVEEQVRNLLQERRMATEEARLALDRQYLSEEEIRDQAEEGHVRFPTVGRTSSSEIRPEEEVERAIEAFKANVYLILKDGRKVESLEETLTLEERNEITFLRLTPLTGG